MGPPSIAAVASNVTNIHKQWRSGGRRCQVRWSCRQIQPAAVLYKAGSYLLRFFACSSHSSCAVMCASSYFCAEGPVELHATACTPNWHLPTNVALNDDSQPYMNPVWHLNNSRCMSRPSRHRICSRSGAGAGARLRSWSATALELDGQDGPEDGAADTQVAELGLEDETEALAFAEQVHAASCRSSCQA